MKNRLAAKVLISAAAIFVMVFVLGYNLAAQHAREQVRRYRPHGPELRADQPGPRLTGHPE